MSRSIFDGVPGPSPWYFKSDIPTVGNGHWVQGNKNEDAGLTWLTRSGEILLALDFHNYVLPLDDRSILIWHQRHAATGVTWPVVLTVLDLTTLAPLDEDPSTIRRVMTAERAALRFKGEPISVTRLETNRVNEDMAAEFPELIRRIDELLILCHSGGIERKSVVDGGNLALLVSRPTEGTYRLYPQDWFNNAELDYGYQWVTRVARNPKTRKVHGEGVRISKFVLDETLRNCA